MKVAANQADRFAKSPDPKLRAVLVYGPDSGLVRERVGTLLRSVVADPGDPFRVAELTAGQLTADPALLGDEAAALALTGGRRVVQVLDAGDELAALFGQFLNDPPGEALVLLRSGDLPARSKLRKVFESADLGAALACYRDDARSLSSVIAEMLGEQGFSASRDALAYLTANLGGDRQLTRRELEKLVLYMGGGGGKVELEDARACVGDSAALSLDDLAYAVGGGDRAGLERALQRSFEEGSNPVAALRGVARHFQRLHFVSGTVAGGAAQSDAMKRLRPPVFWKLTDRFKAQSSAWSVPQLAESLEQLMTAEAACKTTGAPAETIAGRTLLQIATRAPRGAAR